MQDAVILSKKDIRQLVTVAERLVKFCTRISGDGENGAAAAVQKPKARKRRVAKPAAVPEATGA